MPFPSRQAAIAGVYLTEQGKIEGRSDISLQLEAFKGALADAGLGPGDVDGIVTTSPPAFGWSTHHFWAEQLDQKPIGFMDIGSGPGGLAKASAAIAAGMCDVVVYIWGWAGHRIGPKGSPVPTKSPRIGEWESVMHGATFSTWYALWARRYMHEFGATSEELAEVAVTMRHHATLNPDAIMGKRGPITVEDVLASRMIASPLHLLDCALDNDGGYAIVLVSADRARDLPKKPVWVLGGAEASYIDNYINVQSPWFTEEGKAVKRTADRAFAMAGVSRDDIDVAGLYDCYTITVVRNLEEMGFCKLGEGADYIKGGRLRLGGKMPTNTHGGLLSCSHNGNPAGMHLIEVTKQLRGECGERQVPNAKIGVSLAQGAAVHGEAATIVLAGD